MGSNVLLNDFSLDIHDLVFFAVMASVSVSVFLTFFAMVLVFRFNFGNGLTYYRESSSIGVVRLVLIY